MKSTNRITALILALMLSLMLAMPVYAESYQLSPDLDDWDAALAANPSQTQLEDDGSAAAIDDDADSGSLTSNYAAYSPVYITAQMAQNAVAWMTNQVGSASSASTWNGRCLGMVTEAFRQVGINQSGYGTGPLAAQKLKAAGYLQTSANPPAGTLVMFGACSNTRYDPYGYGHAAMSIGGGKIVHAYAGSIRIDNISTVVGHGYPYLGWAVWHAEYGNTMEGVSASAADTKALESFVERLYTVALGRASDAAGKADWVAKLKSGTSTGAQVAAGFINSDEMKSRALSDSDFVNIMYSTFFDRTADSAGFSTWIDALNNGLSREYVLAGFANSSEFATLCTSFGITRGTLSVTQARDQSPALTAFVNRLYTKLLDRQGEEDGLNDWCSRIIKGAQTPKQAAHGFVFSSEFQSKSLSNEKFIEYMYRTFLGREFDDVGKANWLNQMNNGMTREQVFNGFADSTEFADIVKGFGL